MPLGARSRATARSCQATPNCSWWLAEPAAKSHYVREVDGDAPAAGLQIYQPAGRPPLAQRIEGELGRMRRALANLIDFFPMNRRQVEQRLLENDCGTDLGRLLRGRQVPAERLPPSHHATAPRSKTSCGG